MDNKKTSRYVELSAFYEDTAKPVMSIRINTASCTVRVLSTYPPYY